MSRTPVPQRTFADVEFLRQGVQLEPTLQQLVLLLEGEISAELISLRTEL